VNYLAHAYLSFQDSETLVGNLISDFVKGNKKFNYSAHIQSGIVLHRQIDEFTDNHIATRDAKTYFRSAYRLYSGAFVDVVYDHFLANDASQFPGDSLPAFSHRCYSQLDQYTDVFPLRFRQMFHYMKLQDWLYNYRRKEGIYNSFAGLVRRARYMDDHKTAFDIFEKNHDQLKACYAAFFPEVYAFARQKFTESGFARPDDLRQD